MPGLEHVVRKLSIQTALLLLGQQGADIDTLQLREDGFTIEFEGWPMNYSAYSPPTWEGPDEKLSNMGAQLTGLWEVVDNMALQVENQLHHRGKSMKLGEPPHGVDDGGA